jgi:hypothetical protein
MIIIDTMMNPAELIRRRINVAWVQHDVARKSKRKPHWKVRFYHRWIHEDSSSGGLSRRYQASGNFSTGYIAATELMHELKRWSKDFDLLVAIEETELRILFIELMEACGVTATPIKSGAGEFRLQKSED